MASWLFLKPVFSCTFSLGLPRPLGAQVNNRLAATSPQGAWEAAAPLPPHPRHAHTVSSYSQGTCHLAPSPEA